MSDLIYITEDGIHYLNISQKRQVRIEKKIMLTKDYEKRLKREREMLEILDRISDGKKVFSEYFTDMPHWHYGADAVISMLRLGLIKQERWNPPTVYRITPA